jgi:hypothetical protein
MQVKDLTTEELKHLIRETVLEVLEETLHDPDTGLTLRPEVELQLLTIQALQKSGQRGTPAQAIADRYGMNWQ